MPTLDKFVVGPLHVEIWSDPDPMNPRENDNLCRMVCAHRRYDLGDDTRTLGFHFNRDLFDSWEEVGKWLEDEKGAYLVQPLMLVDHGGISIRIGSGRGWDSGPVGFIYITKEAVDREWPGLDPKEIYAKATAHMDAEVESYRRYLDGSFCGYTISNKKGVVESCGNFETFKEAREEAEDMAKRLESWENDRRHGIAEQLEKVLKDIEGLPVATVATIKEALIAWCDQEGV